MDPAARVHGKPRGDDADRPLRTIDGDGDGRTATGARRLSRALLEGAAAAGSKKQRAHTWPRAHKLSRHTLASGRRRRTGSDPPCKRAKGCSPAAATSHFS